jgi:ATP-dependent DNA helicase RecQ
VVRLDSTLGAAAKREALARIGAGGSLLVLTTAETFGSDAFAGALGSEPPSLVAVDEAHTASDWGHDFRPAYLRVGEVAARLGRPPTLALTATATARVRDDLVDILALRDPLVVVRGPHRPNLCFEVIVSSGAARLRALTRLVLGLERPCIVYCATTKDVDAVSRALIRLGVPARHYHGGMKASERKEEQRLFMRPGRRVVMVATSAFGLGINKPDIRAIVHYQAPASIEQYVQEAGRAGRDGKRSDCVLLYSPEDRQIHEFLQSKSRVRPDQLRRLTTTLDSYSSGDGRPTVPDLAETAGIGQRATEALLAALEEAGIVSIGAGRSVTQRTRSRSRPPIRRLVAGLDRLRTLDAERLDAVDAYASTTRCRARFLDEYFGVTGGDPCGVCDLCRHRVRPASFFAPLEPSRRRQAQTEGARGGRKRRRPKRGG